MFVPRNSCKRPVFIELFWDMCGHAANILRRVPPMSELYSPGSCPVRGGRPGYADLPCCPASATPVSSSIGNGKTIVDDLSPAMLLSVCM